MTHKGVSSGATALNIPKNYSGVYFSSPKSRAVLQASSDHGEGSDGAERKKSMGTLISRERACPMLTGGESFAGPGSELPAATAAEAAAEVACVSSAGRKICSEKIGTESGILSVLDPEELLIAGVLILLLREGRNDWLPLALATLLI